MILCLNQLSALFECIQEEAKQNEAFAKRLDKIFSEGSPKREKQKTKPTPTLNPFEAEKEGTLKAQLPALDEQELKVIAHAYGFCKSAQLKKMTKEAVIEIIVQETKHRANHGKSFSKNGNAQSQKTEEKMP